MRVTNTLSRQKEEFKPLEGNTVRMYSCGPTVYKEAHIGNLRSYIFMDSLRRVLKYNGYELKHVMNITDVGHLVSDGDEGEDKILKSAREENKSPMEIATTYMNMFLNDLQRLNVDMPEMICRATDYIPEMLEFVKGLVERGYGYETSTAIYFDVSKLDKYGVLSNVNLDDQKAGARVEVDHEKRNPYDFALWIKAPEEHIMKWDSPWGLCYPGWHIECSTMGKKHLGDQFDIHTGGVDLIPTHHENEIAQSKGLTGKDPVKYWMHCEFLMVDGGKMSKSLGNCYTIDQLIEKGYSPLDYKMLTFTSHYRNKLNFTWEALDAAHTSLIRLKQTIAKHKGVENKIDEKILEEYNKRFEDAINDDLNLPLAMGVLWDLVKLDKSNDVYELAMNFDTVFGLKLNEEEEEKQIEIPEEVKQLVEKRAQAKMDKNYELADSIRNEISSLGYAIEDTKDGVNIRKM